MELKGKTALITGGASGLGEATVRRFVENGANVVIMDLNQARGEELVAELGASVRYCQVNVVDEAQVQAAVDTAVSEFGGVHIACNFAGIGNAHKTVGKEGPFPLDAFKKVIDINLIGTFNVTRLAAFQMSKQDPVTEDGQRGVIMNTASIAAYEGQIGQVAYSASKGGVVGMMLPIARDLAKLGIRCNTIVPGLIHTPMFSQLPPEAIESLTSGTLNPRRLGVPDEIAKTAQFMVENDYVNGETIRVDSGMRMQPR